VEGRRTVLEYLLSPVQKVASEAGMAGMIAESRSEREDTEPWLPMRFHCVLTCTIAERIKVEISFARIGVMTRQREKLQFHKEHLELRAPQPGVVKELTTTTIGTVVQPGAVLLSWVPRNEPLLAEVSIQNEDTAPVRKVTSEAGMER
jgi:HlyD family secretion protein